LGCIVAFIVLVRVFCGTPERDDERSVEGLAEGRVAIIDWGVDDECRLGPDFSVVRKDDVEPALDADMVCAATKYDSDSSVLKPEGHGKEPLSRYHKSLFGSLNERFINRGLGTER
jgi:hypothetical protein